MDAIEALKTRRSTRKYQKTPVSRDVLADMVDCARLAPTAMNRQLADFVVVTDRQRLAAVSAAIGHAPWMTQAPAAIAVLCREGEYSVEDASAATMALLVAAQAHGLGSCWVAGEKQGYAPAVARLVGAPADLRFFALAVVGYPDETVTPEKRPLTDVLHWDQFSRR